MGLGWGWVGFDEEGMRGWMDGLGNKTDDF